MHIVVRDSSMIVDFGFDSSKILQLVESEANKIAQEINSKDLQNWSLHFVFCYTNGIQILISKRTKSVSSIKYKDIVAQIPIPTKDKFSWGVEVEQQVYKDEHYLDKFIKNFYSLKVDFTGYQNRGDYILDTMRRVVKFCFETGFTINRVKVKIENL